MLYVPVQLARVELLVSTRPCCLSVIVSRVLLTALPACLAVPSAVADVPVQVLPDDVAAELPGGLLLRGPAEQLHAVLHLPHAHHLHRVCVCLPGHRTTPQQDARLDVDKVGGAVWGTSWARPRLQRNQLPADRTRGCCI